MRATQRFTAAALVLLLIWMVNQLCLVWSEWKKSNEIPVAHDPTTWKDSPEIAQANIQRKKPSTSRRRPSISDLAPSRNKDTGSLQIIIDDVSRTKTAATDRVVVVGKRKDENTDWVIDELPDWQHAIYTVDDPDAPLRVTKNKGKESSVYLQYIIDHYDQLPATMVFLHSHRDGYPEAWHTEFDEHSNPLTVQLLQTDFVQRNGYANLRCNPTPGCPDEIRPFRAGANDDHLPELLFPTVWQTFFNNTRVPEVVATPCCAQFAVSRDQVWQRPLDSYRRYHRWLMETELSDDVSGRIMEYMWHIIFGQDPVYCPEMEQCLGDVYDLGFA